MGRVGSLCCYLNQRYVLMIHWYSMLMRISFGRCWLGVFCLCLCFYCLCCLFCCLLFVFEHAFCFGLLVFVFKGFNGFVVALRDMVNESMFRRSISLDKGSV